MRSKIAKCYELVMHTTHHRSMITQAAAAAAAAILSSQWLCHANFLQPKLHLETMEAFIMLMLLLVWNSISCQVTCAGQFYAVCHYTSVSVRMQVMASCKSHIFAVQTASSNIAVD